MLFWILAAALTAVVLLIIVPPLLKAPKAEAASPSRGAYDLEVYRDQLSELERDRGRGLITDAQMEAAKAEIARRMLALADEAKAGAAGAGQANRTRTVAALLAVAIPLGALVIYLPLGRPDLPAQPLASRDLAAEERQMDGGPPAPVMEAVQKLKKHLEDNPNDARAWTLMGQTYGRIGRFDQAAEALKRASDLQPDSLEAKSAYAEMSTAANGGTVTEESLRVFQAMLDKDPKDSRARFFLALSRLQAGDAKGALDGWVALVADTPADAPWLPVVQARIKEAATALKLDVASVMPKPAPPQNHPTAGGQQGGDADQDRQIRQMVEQLDAKMRANPADVDGWLKLARSYSVLAEHDKAIEAAKQALDRAPTRVEVRIAYADALLGRAPEDGPLPADAVAALREVLALDAANKEALWLLGLDAAQANRRDEAAELWNRLLAQMDPKDPDRETVRQRLASLKSGG
ncbi:c-type cytochrome biogenesis protein CcmI [Azospirillum sp.]|uniref:c-type cytochrome biogenesis protein CcmI n=1 Tax=Azospirillum sp. TaxID=34012 RepID=UPI003D740A2B